MREMRRYRLEVIAVSVVLGIALAITLANLGSRRYFPIVLAVMGFWFLSTCRGGDGRSGREPGSSPTGTCGRAEASFGSVTRVPGRSGGAGDRRSAG